MLYIYSLLFIKPTHVLSSSVKSIKCCRGTGYETDNINWQRICHIMTWLLGDTGLDLIYIKVISIYELAEG